MRCPVHQIPVSRFQMALLSSFGVPEFFDAERSSSSESFVYFMEREDIDEALRYAPLLAEDETVEMTK